MTQEWVAELEPPEDTGGEYYSAVFLIAGEGPPEHYHIGYEETFEVISGELTVVVEGTPTEFQREIHGLCPPERFTNPAMMATVSPRLSARSNHQERHFGSSGRYSASLTREK